MIRALYIFMALQCLLFIPNSHSAHSLESLITEARENLESDLDQAEDYIEQALKLAPQNPEVNFICGRIMGRQAEAAFFSAFSYAKKSLNCLKTAVKYAPDQVKYHMALLTFYLAAPAIAGGDTELALHQVTQIKQIDDLDGAKAEVQYLLSTENTEQLLKRLITFRTEFAHEPEFHYRHGLLLQEKSSFEQAFNAFNQSIQALDYAIGDDNPLRSMNKPSDARFLLNALYQLGRNAVFSQQYIQAGIDGLLDFVRLNNTKVNTPPTEWAYLRLAQLYHLNGQLKSAEAYINLARQSDDRELHRAIRKIK